MILTDIKHYVAQQGPTTTDAVAAHFDLEPDAALAMLEILARRGGVAAVSDPGQCTGGCGGQCGGCAAGTGIIWYTPGGTTS